ncbi:unnamed protein product [Chironomus riparius]|uniref:Uncharacterized protein n=1 Tax=Chironomus riparius TaxID=315576 RepID=A0A9N9RYC2_9DIPT|nr:unnamed protein product [Chironomus riparius]
MKMFKKFLFLGFLLLSITALSKAQDAVEDEVTTEAVEAKADPEAAIVEGETTANPEADAAETKPKGKSAKSAGVVDEILTFMKETCDKIIKFISGKSESGSDVEPKAAPNSTEDETATEASSSETSEDALGKAGKKVKKALSKKLKKSKKSEETEEAEPATEEEE